MSRIGKKPVAIPKGVDVKISAPGVTVTGPKGTLSWSVPATASVAYDEPARRLTVTRRDDSKQSRANHGLTRALINNMVLGVSEGFERHLEIYGTGYNCKLEGKTLHLNVGFMGRNHGRGSQFEIPVPEGVEVIVEVGAARGDTAPAKLVIRGIDKQKVGEFAADIRALRKTEPYKGKGIRYLGEHVRRKQGKALTSTGG